jgi:hypothetical protein
MNSVFQLKKGWRTVRTFLICLALLVTGCSAGSIQINTDEGEVEYYAVLMGGQKIGHAANVRSTDSGIVTTTEMLSMVIGRGAISMSVSTTETSIETSDGKPIGFEYAEDLGGMGGKKITGRLNEQGRLEITTLDLGIEQKRVIDWPAGAVMAEGLRLLELDKGLTEGVTYQARLFSPALLSVVDADVRIGPTTNIDLFGRVLPLTEIGVSMNMQGTIFTSTSYVDSELQAQKTVMPMMGMNLELIACDKAFALSENDVVDFLEKLLIPSPVELKDLSSTDSITYLLVPADGKNLSIPSTDNQTVQQTKDGKVIVTVKPAAAPVGATFPYAGKDEQLLDALKPAQYLQSGDKKIISLANKAVGDTKDAAEAARKIENFVSEYITEKNLSIGYASAAEVALSRQGDCTEHAVLTAAMCRVAGVPARVVSGIVYIAEFAGRKDVFGGHAWAEAYVGGKWIGLDATRAPDGFGPGHITMAMGNGDPADFFAMANMLGYFKIEEINMGE